MTKNPIGLHVLFALLGLGASMLLLGVGGQFILEAAQYEYNNAANTLTGTLFCVGGVVCLIFSIALIMRLQWAKTAFQVIFILGGVAWMVFIVAMAKDSPQAWSVLTGMGIAGLMIVLFGVLFLESDHFQKDLKHGQMEGKDHWDILDQ
ncbi:MAG: hypothetical protein KDD04_06790 [Sinomicrobium sp.]|nr:hypothetical protein [Sinomicrobium sp.]